MRIRTLLYIFSAAAVVALGFSLVAVEGTQTAYTPRTEVETGEDYLGALEVYQQLRANVETGQIEDEDFNRMREAVAKYTRQVAAQKDSEPIEWIEMGPDNVGGRTRGILCMDENNIISGGVSGGLWKSVNAGDTWTQITSFPNCNVTSIAMAGNGDLYVGTGSLFDGAGGEGGSGFRGQGVYWSNDGGESWSVVDGTDPGVLGGGDWTAVDALEEDPTSNSRVWVGADAGFGYIDNGQLFMGVGDGLPGQSCQDIHIADDGSYMLVVMGSGRVYRSTNNSFTTFQEEFGNGDGELPQSGIGRACVQVVPQNPNHAYAVYATSGGFFGGLYHSGDFGQTWEEVWPGGNPEVTPLPRGQGIYDLCVGASPANPEVAYVGGIEFWRAGPNYQAELAALPFDVEGLDLDMHVDMHVIEFSPNGTMWIGCDGGLYKSLNEGETYIETNRGYNTTQYYGIAYTPNNGVIGGTQDNGSHWIPNDGTFISDQSAFEISGGDGFDCAVPQVTDSEIEVALTTSQNGVLYRLTSDGGFGFIYDDEIIDLQNDEGEIGQFYTCVRLFEDTEDENSQDYIILVNPYEETITDSTFILETGNLDLPFEYTMTGDDILEYWEELIRPERTLDEPLTEDPDYFWLDPQDLTSEIVSCDTTFTQIGEEEVIDEIIPVDSCFYFEPLDSTICITIDYDTTYVLEPIFDIDIDCTTQYFYASDTLFNVRGQMKIQDPYTSMFTIGFVGSQGVWMTRDALNFGVSPNWWRLGTAPGGGGTKAIEYVVGDHDETGDVMFVSGWNGSVWRISGLENLWTDEQAVDTLNNATGLPTADIDGDGVPDGDNYLDVLQWDQIFSTGSAVTGIAVDPNDPNHVVITIGGYGGSQKVRETFNALDEDVDWNNIWFTSGDLQGMPCYDAVIDVTDPSGQTIVVGTEFGIWVTNDGGDTWVPSNAGMQTASDVFACPVFDLKQQWRSSARWTYPNNSGMIYAGTHGRGIFRSEDFSFVSVDENDDLLGNADQLLIYPNPVTADVAQLKIDLTTATDVRMNIYSATGKLVKQINRNNLVAGSHVLQIDAADLPNGNYILTVEMGAQVKTARFVVMK